jgi:hypothetical protein
MRLGKLTHTAILEPDQAHFTAKPKDFDGRLKQWKEWLTQQKGELITADQAQAIEGMKAAVWAHPFGAAALKGALIERSAIGRHADTSLLCKCRPDAIATGNVVADLKTCDSAEMRDFQRSVINYRLRACSHAAKGVFIDTLCLMFECVPRGVLVTGASPWSERDWAAAVGGNGDVTAGCIRELLDKGVVRRRGDESQALLHRYGVVLSRPHGYGFADAFIRMCCQWFL